MGSRTPQLGSTTATASDPESLSPLARLAKRVQSESGVLSLAYAALVVKLFLALVTAGTNDVGTFLRFGEFIRENGLGDMYRSDLAFNHSPLVALLCVVTAPLQSFPFWIRLPGILADLVTVKALLRFNARHEVIPWWALALYAASPVSILVSGYHGNVDPVMTMALVLAVISVTDGRAAASGAWLALAVNIKVAALLLAPLLLAIWWHRRQSRSFATTWIGLTVLGWLPALLVARHEFVAQVLGYSSRWGTWGLGFLAHRLGGSSLQPSTEIAILSPAESVIVALLKVLIVAGVVVIAWRARSADQHGVWRAAALTWAVFFALAPGVGPQYLVWLAPFVLVAAPRAYLMITVASAISLLAIYGITSQWHFEFSHFSFVIRDRWVPWTCLPWIAITAFGMSQIRELNARARTESQ